MTLVEILRRARGAQEAPQGKAREPRLKELAEASD